MELLTHTNIDFMKYRKVFVWLSLLLLVVGGVELFALTGLNLGIDFAGGTQLTVALRDEVSTNDLRNVLQQAGIDAQIQRYGGAEERQVLIKAPVAAGSEEGSGEAMIDALDQTLNQGQAGRQAAGLADLEAPEAGEPRFDLNERGTQALADLLFETDPEALKSGDEAAAREHYEDLAARILDRRKETTLFRDLGEDLYAAVELPAAVRDVLELRTFLGAFHVLQNDNVGPQIGSELRQKGIWAVTLSLVGMLCYIWLRFELRFGVGAMVATFHDFLITLGLFALVGYEFNLSTIAAFLTLVGYSVNDTVVIFDRVRENMRKHRRKPLVEIMNESLNQTLSRTVLTSGTTLLVVASLFFLGGEVIRGFAFVLLVGVIIGTYSSVYVACPFTLLWEQYFGREATAARRSARAAA
jgi:preprotein translocase subunit SecF